MLRLWIKVLLLFVIVDLSGCAATGNREYLSVRKSREIDMMFEQKVMVPGYNYYYNGIKNEPVALLGLDPDYTISEKFWTPSNDQQQFNWWIDEFRRLTGDWDDLARVQIIYWGYVVLDEQGKQIGVMYSRYDWITAWRGAQPNEIVIPSPSTRTTDSGILFRRF